MATIMERFDIMFKGLKAGNHVFGFNLDNPFFEHFDDAELEGGAIDITAAMEKKENLLSFHFRYSGSLKVTCDRCLDIFDMPVVFESSLHVRFDEMTGSEDIDVIFLDPNEHKLNLAGYFIESVRLFMPLKRIHPAGRDGEPGCNREMLEKLDQYKTKENKPFSDPRWDSLKNIKPDRK